MIKVCRAGRLHMPEMVGLLNEIIRAGGTTAMTTQTSEVDLEQWMFRNPEVAAWFVAEDETGRVMGWQCIEPAAYLPPEAAEIGTFARLGHSGLGIGSSLFEQTKIAARALGFKWINANIREDNTGGLIYYQSRGFEDYGRIRDHVLADGTRVDKILKRYDL